VGYIRGRDGAILRRFKRNGALAKRQTTHFTGVVKCSREAKGVGESGFGIQELTAKIVTRFHFGFQFMDVPGMAFKFL